MQVYYQLGKSDQAVDAAKKVLDVDPDNLDALAFLSYVFPFTFKGTDADATAKLSRAESDARHGLDVLQKFPKPANVTDAQFKHMWIPNAHSSTAPSDSLPSAQGLSQRHHRS